MFSNQSINHILSAELTKKHSFRPFFSDFAHWETSSKLRLLFTSIIEYYFHAKN